MPSVEYVRIILERTFGMPVAESDAQIVLDRLNEIASKEVRPTLPAADGTWTCPPPCNRVHYNNIETCVICNTSRRSRKPLDAS